MALINCPECGKEVSTSAVACPNCGRPLAAAAEERTVVREVPPPVVERDSFPKWVFVPLAVLGAVLIFLLVALFRQEDDNQRNINVDVSARRPAATDTDTSSRTGSDVNQPVVPVSPVDSNISTMPSNVSPISNTTVSQIPADTQSADQGTLSIEAKISDRTGGTRPVKAEKFYLLDKDLETILSDAEIEPISGQSLKNSFGLAVLYPDKYGKLRDKALSEINKHIKYDVLTDATGKARMQAIKPDSYYLFAITKTTNGFAIWSSPIVINPGQNVLNLTPQQLNEIPE